LGGQLRIITGAVIGWDMAAALALGAALGIPALAVAELLPPIEAVMVRKINEAVNGRVKVSQMAAQNVATLGLARLPRERAPASGRPRFS
jgi:hypothetical protein